MKGIAQYLSLLAIMGFAALVFGASPALAATSPTLGSAQSYGVLAGSAVTNTGPTTIFGDLGISPSIGLPPHYTGFPPGMVILPGTIHDADTNAGLAQAADTAAFGVLDQVCTTTYTGTKDLVGLNLVPGVYCADAFTLSGTLTLSGSGVWIFKSSSSLITSGTANVVGGDPCNVWWRVVSSATLGTNTQLIGNILALTSITLQTGATLNGRALAQTGLVAMDSNVITPSICAAPTSPTPTLGKGFSPFTINETNNVSTLTITLSNPSTGVATLTASLIDILPTGVTIANTPNVITTCGGTGVSATAGGPNVTLLAGSTIPAASFCTVKVDVTALHNGSYINTLPANALQTDHGNNTLPAIATLTVVPSIPPGGPPMLGKGFSPFTIDIGGVSTLTIMLSNPNNTSVATLTAPFIDNLPTGVTIANTPNVINTCNGTVLAIAGGSNVTMLTDNQIPNGTGSTAGFCTVMVDVTAPLGGSYLNTLPANILQTSNGNNTLPTIATLNTQGLISTVPAFTPTGIAVMAGLLALAAIVTLRRRL